MKRKPILVLAMLVATACAPAAPERCDFTVTREITFTNPTASDTLVARAIGATCDKATLLFTISDADEHPVWAWASPMPRAFGDAVPADEPEQMQDFLERWAQPEILSTSDAPEWRSLAAGQTTLDQFTYEDIRARDLPMLCHYSGTARQTCVFWEPAASGAGLLYDRDIEETTE